jgi:glyoxylase-like metal-dependent hydrolase (beta-lactamase superfamily II)
LWKSGGGSKEFGFDLDVGHPPNTLLSDQESLTFSDIHLTILHTPGHTSGHVTFHLPLNTTAFCGDLIFFHGVGRTDLSNGDEDQLANSIRGKIFTLPNETLLYPGHGPETSVEEEMANNPFLQSFL